MLIALCLFLTGALAGIYLAFRHFTHRRLPGTVAVLHGVIGATAFAFLLFAVVRRPDFAPAKVAMGIIIGAVILGCVNAVYHLRGRRHRSAFIVAHALTAVSGVGTLAYGLVVDASTPPPSSGDSRATKSPPASSTATERSGIDPNVAAASAPEPSASVAPAAPLPDAGAKTAPAVGFAFEDRSIVFDGNSANLTSDARTALLSIAAEMKSHPAITLLEVQAHADPRGSDAFNVAISRARARAVVDALVGSGVSRSRVRNAAYGSRCPLDAACTASSCQPEGLAKERRVQFLILEAGGKKFHGRVACENGAPLMPAEDARYHTKTP